MAFQRRALLVLDLQKEFLDPNVGRCLLPKLPPPFLKKLESLLPKFQGRQNDVFWFRSESKEQRDFTDLSVEERIIVVESKSDDESDESHEEDSNSENEDNNKAPPPSVRPDQKTSASQTNPPHQRQHSEDLDTEEDEGIPRRTRVLDLKMRPPPIRPLPRGQGTEDLDAEDIDDDDMSAEEDPSLVNPAPPSVLRASSHRIPLSARPIPQKVAGARRRAPHRPRMIAVVRRGHVGSAARPPLLTDAYLSIDSPHPPVAPNTPASEWYDPIIPWIQRHHIVMKKSWYSAFKDTDLLFQLRGRMISEIYVCGVMSNVGVLATVADAVRHGIACTVIEDCCGYRNGEANARAIDLMTGEFEVDVVKMEDVKGTGAIGGGLPPQLGTAAVPKVGATAMATEELLKTLAGIGMPKENIPEYGGNGVAQRRSRENTNGSINGHMRSAQASEQPRSESSPSQSSLHKLQGPSSPGKESSAPQQPSGSPSTRALEDSLRNLALETPAQHPSSNDNDSPIEIDDGNYEYVLPLPVKLPRRTRTMEPPLARGRTEGRGSSSNQPWPIPPWEPGKNNGAPVGENENELLPGEGLLEIATPEKPRENTPDEVMTSVAGDAAGARPAPPPIPERRSSLPGKRAPPPVPDKPKPETARRMSLRRSSAAADPEPLSSTTPQGHAPPHRKTSSTSAPVPYSATTPAPTAPTDLPSAAVALDTSTPPPASPSTPASSSGKPKRKLPKGFQSSAPVLSAGDNIGTGDSSLHLSLLPAPLSDTAFSSLLSEVQWRTMYHRGGEVPRLVAVQGAINPEDGSFPIYRHPADESPPLMAFTDTVEAIRKEAERVVGHPLNHVLIQCYRGGGDFISEHADKSLDIARGTSIVNVSLGAQRTMILRRKKAAATDTPTSTASDGPQQRELQRVPLPHNSLFILGPNTNTHFQHSIKQDKRETFLKTPEELAENGTRISLTFRHIATYLSADETRIWGQGAVCKIGPSSHSSPADLPGRPIVLGPCPEAERLLAAFGKENQLVEFDWDAEYGPGFDVLHFIPPVPKLRRYKPISSSSSTLGLQSDPNARAAAAAADESAFEARKMESILRLKGMKFEIEDVVRPAAATTPSLSQPSTIPQETLPAFIDTDRDRTMVHGAVALVSYLERWHPNVGRPLLPRNRSDYVLVVERLVEAQSWGGGGRMGEKERMIEEKWPMLRALRGLMVVGMDENGTSGANGSGSTGAGTTGSSK